MKRKVEDFIKKIKENKNAIIVIDIAIVLIISLSFFLILFKKNGMFYCMNDDIAMRSIVSGVYLGGEQSTYMIFSGFPVSFILMALYKITIKIDWYGLLLVGSMFFYLSYFIYSVIKEKEKISEKIFYTCGILFLVSMLLGTFLVDITFTVVASFVATCSLLLYILPYDKKRNIVMASGILISYGIRAKACLMILAFFIPVFIYKNIKSKEGLKKDFILGVKIGIVLLICIIIQKSMMNNASWKQYLAYNEYRSLFYDYYFTSVLNLPEDEKKQLFHDAGFSDKEMELLCEYGAIGFYEDIPSKMEGLIEQCKAHGLTTGGNYMASYKYFLKNTELVKPYFITLLILVYYALRTKERKTKIPTMLLLIIFQFAVLSYLVYQGRLPDRVVIPLFASFISMNIAILLNEDELKRISSKILNYDKILTIIIAGILLVNSIESIESSKALRDESELANETLKYFAENPDNFYIYDRNSLETIHLRTRYRANNYLNMSGWSVFSPLHSEKLNKYGAKTVKDVLLEPNVYLVIPFSNADKYKVIYDDVNVETIDVINGNYVYKFSK